jgi:hypothetical protein
MVLSESVSVQAAALDKISFQLLCEPGPNELAAEASRLLGSDDAKVRDVAAAIGKDLDAYRPRVLELLLDGKLLRTAYLASSLAESLPLHDVEELLAPFVCTQATQTRAREWIAPLAAVWRRDGLSIGRRAEVESVLVRLVIEAANPFDQSVLSPISDTPIPALATFYHQAVQEAKDVVVRSWSLRALAEIEPEKSIRTLSNGSGSTPFLS